MATRKIYASTTPNIELYTVIHEADVRDAEGHQLALVKIRTFQYGDESHFIGPTIVAKPGDLVNVTLTNNLFGVGRATKISELLGSTNAWLKDDKFKDPDVTNLHTHGLHVNPLVDDVLKWASPHCPKDKGVDAYFDYLDCYDPDYSSTTQSVTNTINYPYELPSTHYPGTHWYVLTQNYRKRTINVSLNTKLLQTRLL